MADATLTDVTKKLDEVKSAVKAGEVATDGELNSMNYYVEGITARFPD
jgi:hypothetical protein